MSDSDQPGHLHSLIRVFAVRMKKAWVLSYPMSAERRLWSDRAKAGSSLGAQLFCWFCHEGLLCRVLCRAWFLLKKVIFAIAISLQAVINNPKLSYVDRFQRLPGILWPLLNTIFQQHINSILWPAPVDQSVEYPLRGTGGHGLDTGPRRTKVIKIVFAVLAWHSDLWGRSRTGRPNVRIMLLGVLSCQVSQAWHCGEAAL